MKDEALRRRALEQLGALAPALALEALETGILEVERDVLQWEGTLGSIHGNRVTLVTPLREEVLLSPAVVDVLTAAIAAANEGHDSLAELVIAQGERLHGSPYRGR